MLSTFPFYAPPRRSLDTEFIAWTCRHVNNNLHNVLGCSMIATGMKRLVPPARGTSRGRRVGSLRSLESAITIRVHEQEGEIRNCTCSAVRETKTKDSIARKRFIYFFSVLYMKYLAPEPSNAESLVFRRKNIRRYWRRIVSGRKCALSIHPSPSQKFSIRIKG